jgi:diguanylate cyclase (GGDEF)-like protein/PAS domain S-box-containing protein
MILDDATRAKPRLIGLVWPFVVVVLVQLIVAGVSLYTMSAVRAYVGAESFWSKGQKEAIYFLDRYADTGRVAFFHRYRQAIAVPLADRRARLELDQPAPNYAAVRQSFLAGGNHPDDVGGLIWLYRNFHNVGYLARSVEHWAEADEILTELDGLARRLHQEIQGGTVTPTDLEVRKTELFHINGRIEPLAKKFAQSLGEGSRMIMSTLMAANVFTAILLIVLAMRRTSKLVAQRHGFERALTAEKERKEITLASIGEAVISTDAAGNIDFVNAAAEWLTNCNSEDAVGRPLNALFTIVDAETGVEYGGIAERLLSGRTIPTSVRPQLLVRTDGTKTAVSLIGTPLRVEGVIAGAVLVLHDKTSEQEYIDRLSWQASHDTLTDLANRREFEARLEKALGRQSLTPAQHALMFVDLDQFKIINDTCGHAAGDQLLREVSATLRDNLPEGALLARLGGDEFGILLENCRPEDAAETADKLRRTIKTNRFVWSGRPFNVTASIGLVHAGEAHFTLEETLRAADVACYIAKEKGRDRVQLYRPGDSELQERFGEMAWVQKIQRAVEENRFLLFAQEIVPLGGSDDGAHVELLVRLHDEHGRLIGPGAFLPAAERYGLMLLIDRWVVRNAFARVAERWAKGAQPLATCAINLSGMSFGDDSFPDYVREQIELYGIAPETICFEVTETSAIADLERAKRFIGALKGLGCRFSLDDFGTGMSSFSYLKNLPVDYLKIDGSFVRDMLKNRIDRAMVEMIAHVGEVTGKQTIAECAEDADTLVVLRDLGIHHAQGFAIARPRLFDVDQVFVTRAVAMERMESPGTVIPLRQIAG